MLMMENSYIVAEIVSITVLGILLYANIFETDHHTKRKKYFTNLLTVCFILSIVDLVTYFRIDWLKHSTLLAILFSITYVFSFLIQLAFAEYLYVYISEKIETKKWPFISIRVYSVLLCAVSIYTCLTGKLFYIENGMWYPGEFETTYYLLYFISLLYLLFILVINAKKLGLHDFIASFLFAFLPLVSTAVATITGYNLAVSLLAIDSLLIYIMLEADKEDTLIYWSNYDELTGLFNRRAYEKDLNEMKNKPIANDLVYIIADVNGLKQVNDTLGHDAGDELIIAAGNVLKRSFGEYGKVYRIGGDEFVAIINADENKLKALKETLESEINSFEGKIVESLSISIGYASKKHHPNDSLENYQRLPMKKCMMTKHFTIKKTVAIEEAKKMPINKYANHII